jgi:iron complex outermembrane receptor protein
MASEVRGVAVLILLVFLLTWSASAATVISGKVHDAQGRPVKGATVAITGTALKALTDDSGAFTIQLPDAATKPRLLFEAPGFYPANVAYEAGQGALDVALAPRVVITEDVVVIAPRLDMPIAEAPAATSVVGADAIAAMPRAIAVDEALQSVPGVKVDNQADGERVHMSIRGQGILSERGIRGIQVLLDGIPLNDPSGFASDVFDVDWAGVRDVEVVRGPVAFLYGGGSGGGVISIRTDEPAEDTHGNVWTTGGSNAFYKMRGEVSGTARGVAWLLSGSRNAGDGYRQHTAFWANNVYGKLSFKPTPRLRLNVTGFGTGFWNQNAEGLNLAWLAQDRRMANPDALTFNEYQKTVRGTGGLTGQWSVSERQRVSFVFYSRRTQYTEPVPSNVDHRTITAPGGSLQYDLEGGAGRLKHHFSSGVDLDGQYIDETKFLNLGNAVEGDRVADQSITQRRYAVFFTERLGLGKSWSVLASVRADWFGNRLEDRMGTATGERNFQRTTGRVGVMYHPREEVGVYASWGQGFTPPATEELTTNPAAFGGFNMTLVPATSWGGEVGVRGSVRGNLYYDAAVFRLDTRNDFERYRCPQPGAVCYPATRPLETFYANAGETRRYGLETTLRWLPVRRLTLTAAYTYSHFQYTKYTSFVYSGDLTGNNLPNSPLHQVFAEGMVELPRGFQAALGTQAFSRAYIDPTNRAWIDGYGLLNARVSKGFQLGRTYATLSFNGRNLAATKYIAFTEPDPDGNSYQPGPEREVFAALQVRF